jgi:ABC-type branched-subunit amino acid transport system substrate-binding protein
MPRSRRVAATALAAASLVVISACGSRAPSTLRQQAANAAVNGGGGIGASGNGVGASTGPNGAGGTGAGGTGAAGPGGSGATGPGAAGATGPGGTAGNAPRPVAGGNGGATDVGVTANSIVVGNVADRTGPVPGLFATAPDGVDAYFKYVNSQGGVNGRFLYVDSQDSQTTCSGATTAHEGQVNKDFAWVGSFEIYDDCGTDNVIKKHPTIPDISFALGPHTKANSVNNIPPEAQPPGYETGMFCYWAKKYGSAISKVGSIYPNLPAPATSQAYFKKASESCGWHWVYNNPEPAAQTTFYSDVLNMKRRGVKLVFLSAENGQNAATLKSEADSQGFKPIWVIPIAYASDFLSRLGGGNQSTGAKAGEGIVGSNLYAMFFSPDDARNIPQVALFQKWMKQAHPEDAVELYAMYGWCSAKLFVQALKAAGPKATRKAVLAAAKNIHSFDCDGMLPANDVNNHHATPNQKCYLLWHIHNGGYYREDTPAARFRCDGTYVAG